MIDIIIVSHGNPKITIHCLHALAKTDSQESFRVIWIDNGSEAGERKLVNDCLDLMPFDSLRRFQENNLGFSRAANIGIRESLKGDAAGLILMNNDVVVADPGWLNRMIDFQAGHPRTGIIGCLTNTGRIQNFERYQKITGYESGDPMEYHNSLPPMIKEITSSCVPFSCVLLNRRMVEKVGFLDEDFSPGYGDDDDYCDRARMAGWKTVILLNVIVYHAHGETFKAIFDEKELGAMKARSRQLYFQKKNQRRGI